jgi:hypothetical protein
MISESRPKLPLSFFQSGDLSERSFAKTKKWESSLRKNQEPIFSSLLVLMIKIKESIITNSKTLILVK